MEDNKKAAIALGTEPIGKLLTQYAVPAVIAMTASSLYNMIDSIFIGQGVGPLAISGLAITFPLMNLAAAFGAGVGVGASTCISVKLGQRDYKTAEQVLGNNVTLNLIIGIAVGLLGLIFLEPILRFFGASDQTLPYARDYMQIILGANVFSHMYFGMNAVLRSSGKPKQAMIATIMSVIINVALAPIFIWVFGWGIRGAAIATVVAQLIALVWQFYLLSNQSELLHLQPPFKRVDTSKHNDGAGVFSTIRLSSLYRLNGNIVRNILAIGVSPFAMNACACLVVIFINNALVSYGGDLAVGAYGIANRIGFLFFMVVMGLNQGMQPIAGYNYGARHYDRLRRVFLLTVAAATSVMIVGWLVGELMPRPCARLFTSDEELIRLSIEGIRINMLAFSLIGTQAVITNFFQSIGKAKVSIFLSLSRQLIFLLPLVILLPPIMGVNGVWYSFPASDVVAFVVAVILMAIYLKKLKK